MKKFIYLFTLVVVFVSSCSKDTVEPTYPNTGNPIIDSNLRSGLKSVELKKWFVESGKQNLVGHSNVFYSRDGLLKEYNNLLIPEIITYTYDTTSYYACVSERDSAGITQYLQGFDSYRTLAELHFSYGVYSNRCGAFKDIEYPSHAEYKIYSEDYPIVSGYVYIEPLKQVLQFNDKGYISEISDTTESGSVMKSTWVYDYY